MTNLPMWRNETLIFYLSIFLISYFLSIIFNKIIFKNNNFEIKLNIIIPFFILLSIKGFAQCGTDLITNYKYNFESALNLNVFRDNTTEIGYRLTTILIRNISDNYNLYVFIFAILTLYPIYKIINKYRNYIDVSLTILAYCFIFFLPGISLMRIYLAASISLIAFDSIMEKKYLKSIIWMFVAASFHITVLLVLTIIMVCVFKINKKVLIVSLISIILVIYLKKDMLLNLMNGRYGVYGISKKVEIGMEFFWYYFPLVLLYLYVVRIFKKLSIRNDIKYNKSFIIFNTSFLFVLVGIFISLIQYVVPIFGRMYAYTLPIIFFIGSSLFIIKKYSKKIYIRAYIYIFTYLIIRFLIYLYEYHLLDGIMPYRNFFNFII